MKETRVNKYLSEVGFCSRRAADKLIEQQRVTINGTVPEMGTKVKEGDVVCVNGKQITDPGTKPVYIALNKPVGIVCTTDQKREKNNIIDFINFPSRIFPIGRLDKPSEGLILLTNDGDIVNKILRARNNHEKEYIVTVDAPITSTFVERMSKGVPILDTVTRECKVEQISKFTFRIVLTQGLNRQIRRMSEYLGYEVTKLKRVRIMNIPLDIPTGKWRDVTPEELTELTRLCEDSSKTHEFEASATTISENDDEFDEFTRISKNEQTQKPAKPFKPKERPIATQRIKSKATIEEEQKPKKMSRMQQTRAKLKARRAEENASLEKMFNKKPRQ